MELVENTPPPFAYSNGGGEVTDELVASHSLEDEPRPRVEAPRHPPEGRVPIEPLRGEAHPEELLRRHSAKPPETSGLAREAVVVLAGRSLPMLGSVPAPHLDKAPGGIHRRDPVKTVPTHVHEPSAPIEVGAQPLEHRERVVLGMGPRQNDAVRFEGRGAPEMEVLVREEVHLEPFHLEPVHEVGIRHELPRIPGIDLRTHVGDGAEARGVTDAAPVAVPRGKTRRSKAPSQSASSRSSSWK